MSEPTLERCTRCKQHEALNHVRDRYKVELSRVNPPCAGERPGVETWCWYCQREMALHIRKTMKGRAEE